MKWRKDNPTKSPIKAPDLKSFCLLVFISMWKDFHPKSTQYWKWKIHCLHCRSVCALFTLEMTQAWAVKGLTILLSIHCLQACVCTFHPGNDMGMGSEGVNNPAQHKTHSTAPLTFLCGFWRQLWGIFCRCRPLLSSALCGCSLNSHVCGWLPSCLWNSTCVGHSKVNL